jgi:hypothetical protein
MQRFFARQKDTTLSLMLKMKTLYGQPEIQKNEANKFKEIEEPKQEERPRSKTL